MRAFCRDSAEPPRTVPRWRRPTTRTPNALPAWILGLEPGVLLVEGVAARASDPARADLVAGVRGELVEEAAPDLTAHPEWQISAMLMMPER